MNMEMLSAMQTRIEMQEEPTVASVSFDRDAANMFQAHAPPPSPSFTIGRPGRRTQALTAPPVAWRTRRRTP